MAIQKTKVLKSGTVGNYWKIMTITIDAFNGKVIGQIALFKDKDASDNGAHPMNCIKTFRFPFVMNEIMPPTNVVAYMYEQIQLAADVEITRDILGNLLPIPTTVDPDLSGGVPV